MKTTLKVLAVLIVGFILGWCTNTYTSQKPLIKEVVIPDSVVQQEREFIDSLHTIRKDITLKRDSMKSELEEAEKLKASEIERIKSLPLDSGVDFLNSKLREYEN